MQALVMQGDFFGKNQSMESNTQKRLLNVSLAIIIGRQKKRNKVMRGLNSRQCNGGMEILMIGLW